MGTLTLTQLQDEVRSGLGERTDLDSRLTRFLDQAQVKIARRHNWKELKRREALTLTYTGTPLTDRFLAFSSLTNTNPRLIYGITLRDSTTSWPITRIPQRTADRALPARDLYSTNKIRHYIQWNDKFEWSPVPDQAYALEMRLLIWPIALTGSNTSDLDEKDDLIILDALRRAKQSLGMYDGALSIAKQFEFDIQDAIIEDAAKPDLFLTPDNSMAADTVATDYWADAFMRKNP